jgi:hypothetical protein
MQQLYQQPATKPYHEVLVMAMTVATAFFLHLWSQLPGGVAL